MRCLSKMKTVFSEINQKQVEFLLCRPWSLTYERETKASSLRGPKFILGFVEVAVSKSCNRKVARKSAKCICVSSFLFLPNYSKVLVLPM